MTKKNNRFPDGFSYDELNFGKNLRLFVSETGEIFCSGFKRIERLCLFDQKPMAKFGRKIGFKVGELKEHNGKYYVALDNEDYVEDNERQFVTYIEGKLSILINNYYPRPFTPNISPPIKTIVFDEDD